MFSAKRKENDTVMFFIEGVDRGGGGTGIEGAESGVKGADRG